MSEFDITLPTYIVTHGWQPDAYFTADDWSFASQPTAESPIPVSQTEIYHAILERLADGDDAPVDANILVFEWEGAYTGGGELYPWEKGPNSQAARIYADYAGVLLGHALNNTFADGYDENIHFVGHSYGTVVNGLATRYLDGQDVFQDNSRIQFTTLDSPTNAPLNFAPSLDANWFQNNLSSQVDYLDNYYGDDGAGNLEAYGEELFGAGLNQVVDYDHGDVALLFYPELILEGPGAETNPGVGFDIGKYSHGFQDWITPMLNTWDDRPEGAFTTAAESVWEEAISQNFENAIGTGYAAISLPGHAEFDFAGLLLQEQSPVSVFQTIDVPMGAEWLSFDWMVGSGGDGDWITTHFEDQLLWNMMIDELIEGVLLDTLIDISDFAGTAGRLFFTLNNVGETNAEVYFGNLKFLGSFDRVPEPGAIILLLFGLVGLRLAVRRRRAP